MLLREHVTPRYAQLETQHAFPTRSEASGRVGNFHILLQVQHFVHGESQ